MRALQGQSRLRPEGALNERFLGMWAAQCTSRGGFLVGLLETLMKRTFSNGGSYPISWRFGVVASLLAQSFGQRYLALRRARSRRKCLHKFRHLDPWLSGCVPPLGLAFTMRISTRSDRCHLGDVCASILYFFPDLYHQWLEALASQTK